MRSTHWRPGAPAAAQARDRSSPRGAPLRGAYRPPPAFFFLAQSARGLLSLPALAPSGLAEEALPLGSLVLSTGLSELIELTEDDVVVPVGGLSPLEPLAPLFGGIGLPAIVIVSW